MHDFGPKIIKKTFWSFENFEKKSTFKFLVLAFVEEVMLNRIEIILYLQN